MVGIKELTFDQALDILDLHTNTCVKYKMRVIACALLICISAYIEDNLMVSIFLLLMWYAVIMVAYHMYYRVKIVDLMSEGYWDESN